ncbi:receptor-type tyrosine-protein phosphatase eta-like [Diadema antillarum]|uniref:receptor-type tyrosine-protein phosphatase eta-like n=2 Tax=Diadema antillarum TaxID=105358 RepID=UPI003A84E6D4
MNSKLTVPAVPGEVRCTYSTQSLIRFYWNETQEGNFDGYEISIMTSSETEPSVLENRDAQEETRMTADFLDANTDYTIQVRSTRRDLRSEPSTEICPTDPEEITLTDSGEGSLVLRWTTTAYSEFEVEYDPEEGQPPSPAQTTPQVPRELSFTSLTPGTVYRFTLFGLSGENRTEITGITHTLPPVAPTVTVQAQSPVTIVIIIVIPPRGRFAFFLLSIRRRAQPQGSGTFLPGEGDFIRPADACPEFVFTDLEPGTDYTITVSSVAADGTTESSSVSVDGTTDPLVSSQISFVEVTTSSVRFVWGAVTDEDFGAYILDLREGTSGSTSVATATVFSNATRLEHTFSGLNPGNQYRVDLIVNSMIRRSALTFTSPNPPTAVDIFNINTTSMTVSWSAPSNIFDGFQLCWAYSRTESVELGRDVRERVLSGLQPNRAYLVSLAAVVGTGSSQMVSEKITRTVMLAAPVTLNASVTSFNSTSISIAWDADVVVDDATGFRIRAEASNGSTLPDVDVGKEEREFTLTDLVPGYRYAISITLLGSSRASEGASVEQYTEPESVSEIRIRPAQPYPTLTWDRPTGNVSSYLLEIDSCRDPESITDLSPMVTVNFTCPDPGSRTWMIRLTSRAGYGMEQTKSEVLEIDASTADTTLSILDRGVDSIKVMFEAMAELENVTVGLLDWTATTAEQVFTCNDNASCAANHTFSQLVSGSLYTIYAQPNFVSNILGIPITTEAYTIPESAVDLMVTAIGQDYITVTWQNPAGQVGDYNVTYVPDNTTNAPRFQLVEVTSQSALNELSLTGLDADVEYVITVISLLEVAEGVVVMGDPVDVQAVTGLQGGFNITDVETDSISIEYELVVHDHVDEYVIAYNGSGIEMNVTRQLNDANMYEITDLTPGTEYTISVRPVSPQEYYSSVTCFPLPPSNFRFPHIKSDSIRVAWNPPAEGDVDMYNLTSDPLIDGLPIMLRSSVSERLFNGLSPLTNYSFTISSLLGSLESSVVTIRTRTPRQSLNLEVEPSDSTTNFFLTWSDLDEGNFTSFCLEYTPYAPGNFPDNGDSEVLRSTRRHEFYRLSPGEEYTVTVTTCISSIPTGDGEERIMYRLPPAPATGIRVAEDTLSTTSVTLEWDEPDGIRDRYEFALDPSTEGNFDDMDADHSVTISNLAPGKRYVVDVTAISGNRNSSTTQFTFHTLPDAPQNLVVSDVSTTTAELSWSDPIQENIPIVRYVLDIEPGASDYPVDINPSATSRSLTGLTPGASYTATLASVVEREDDSPLTGAPESSTPFLMIPSQPTDLTVTMVSLTAIRVSWQPSEGEVDAYAYSYSPGRESGTTTDTFVDLTNLGVSTAYAFRVRAQSNRLNNDGDIIETKFSQNLSGIVSTKPPVPSSFQVTAVTATSMTWTWVPSVAGVTSYIIAIKDSDGATVGNGNMQVTGTSYTQDSLLPFSVYTATIFAEFNEVLSDALNAAPQRTLASKPGVVTTPSIAPTTPVEAEVVWSPPTSPNGVIANYTLTVFRSPEVGQLVQLRQIAVTADASLTTYSQAVGSLTTGNYYVFSVVATNGIASSDQSYSMRVLFPETAPPAPSSSSAPQLVSRGNTITISFQNPFSEIYGPIARFAIIVQERSLSSLTSVARRQTSNELTWAEARRSRPVPQYQTTPTDYYPFSSNAQEQVTYTVGSDGSCDPNDLTEYCNGALYPSTAYSFILRAYGEDGKFADTPASDVFRTQTDFGIFYIPAIILGLIVAVLLIIFMAIGMGCCGRPGDALYDDENSVSYPPEYMDRYGNGHSNGYGNGYTNGQIKRRLIDVPYGKNEFEMESPLRGEENPYTMPPHPTLPPQAAVSADVHRPEPEPQLTNPVKIGSFAQHVSNLSDKNNSGFSEEYNNLLAIGGTRAMTVARQENNATKNRYRNILPFDYTRVKLAGVVGNDYINANFIKDQSGNKKYIATQGPMPQTIEDFWEMVWENQAGTIVMMSALVEGGKTKCERYWPANEEPLQYGNTTVSLVNSNQSDYFIQRTLKLEKEGSERTVVHYQFTAWTDHGVPETTEPLLDLIRKVQASSAEDHGPVVVHCSAGVGRTGTFIAADILARKIERSNLSDYIDVYNTVATLREQRALMVQTQYQYIYLHRVTQAAIEGQ